MSHYLPLYDFSMSSRKHPTSTSHTIDVPETLAPPFTLFASSWPDARCDDARSLFIAASENNSREILVVNLCTPKEIKEKQLTDYLPVLAATCTTYRVLNIPTKDRHAFDTDCLLQSSARTVIDSLVNQHGVVVHCLGGHGRTGLLVGAVLALVYGDMQLAGDRFLQNHRTRPVNRCPYLTFPQCKAQRKQARCLLCAAFKSTATNDTISTSDITAFYKGPFSNWYLAPFLAPMPVQHNETEGLIFFSCLEQYLMLSKAILFGDKDSESAIMSVDDPREHKKIGRKVKNYDENMWSQRRQTALVTGLRYRFGLSVCGGPVNTMAAARDLRMLIDTGTTEIVEASPYDSVWGVGKNVAEASNGKKVPGALNLLGKCLMHIRGEAMDDTETTQPAKRLKVM